LVFIAASTGIRQSELFALKWDDINFSAGTMNVTRSIVHGFVGPCKTESSQKPVPIHPLVAEALDKWRSQSPYRLPEDWVFASRHSHGQLPYWGQAILHKYLRTAARELGIEKRFGGHTFRHTYSTLLRSVGTEFKVMQGASPALDHAINPGRLHASNHTCQTECTGRCHVAGLLF
jgi:integrase